MSRFTDTLTVSALKGSGVDALRKDRIADAAGAVALPR